MSVVLFDSLSLPLEAESMIHIDITHHNILKFVARHISQLNVREKVGEDYLEGEERNATRQFTTSSASRTRSVLQMPSCRNILRSLNALINHEVYRGLIYSGLISPMVAHGQLPRRCSLAYITRYADTLRSTHRRLRLREPHKVASLSLEPESYFEEYSKFSG